MNCYHLIVGPMAGNHWKPPLPKNVPPWTSLANFANFANFANQCNTGWQMLGNRGNGGARKVRVLYKRKDSIRYFVAKLSIVAIYVLFWKATIELSTKVILLSESPLSESFRNAFKYLLLGLSTSIFWERHTAASGIFITMMPGDFMKPNLPKQSGDFRLKSQDLVLLTNRLFRYDFNHIWYWSGDVIWIYLRETKKEGTNWIATLKDRSIYRNI